MSAFTLKGFVKLALLIGSTTAATTGLADQLVVDQSPNAEYPIDQSFNPGGWYAGDSFAASIHESEITSVNIWINSLANNFFEEPITVVEENQAYYLNHANGTNLPGAEYQVINAVISNYVYLGDPTDREYVLTLTSAQEGLTVPLFHTYQGQENYVFFEEYDPSLQGSFNFLTVQDRNDNNFFATQYQSVEYFGQGDLAMQLYGSPAPEPSELAVLFLGSCGIWIRRRKR